MFKYLLLLGDIVTLGIVTVFGFSSHNELETAGWRMLTTFFPLILAWLIFSPHFGVYDPARVAYPRQLWRPFWAMVLAGPFAAWIRGAWLNMPIQPLFVFIIGGVSALAILAWRTIYWFMVFYFRRADG